MKWIKRIFEGIYNSFKIAGKMIIDVMRKKRDDIDKMIKFFENWLEENKFEK